MKRLTLASLAAVVVGAIAFLALQHHYESGAAAIDVSDGQGHGPDRDTSEWQGAVRATIQRQSAFGGVAIGFAAFSVVLWSVRPSHRD